MTNSQTIMTKETRSSNMQPNRRIRHLIIWEFFSHSDLGFGHSAQRYGLEISHFP
jgi:hypothetical protein